MGGNRQPFDCRRALREDRPLDLSRAFRVLVPPPRRGARSGTRGSRPRSRDRRPERAWRTARCRRSRADHREVSPRHATAAKTDAPASTIQPSRVHLRCRVSSVTETTKAAMLPTTSALIHRHRGARTANGEVPCDCDYRADEIDPPHVAQDAALTPRERRGREQSRHDQDHVSDHVRYRVPVSLSIREPRLERPRSGRSA